MKDRMLLLLRSSSRRRRRPEEEELERPQTKYFELHPLNK
jgi:hypothetical protein